MYETVLRSAEFFEVLLGLDEVLAEEARQSGCSCGGVLHRGDYPRKPRGGPEGLSEEHELRFSFCCAVDGCRRRRTPPSVRFLGRKVYWGAVVLLVPILMEGPTPSRVMRLQRYIGVSVRTLRRWRRWWRQCVGASRWFAAARGSFVAGVAGEALPASLLEAFSGLVEIAERVVAVLRWLAPLSGGPEPSAAS